MVVHMPSQKGHSQAWTPSVLHNIIPGFQRSLKYKFISGWLHIGVAGEYEWGNLLLHYLLQPYIPDEIKIFSDGAPMWLSWLGHWLFISAQVMKSGS